MTPNESRSIDLTTRVRRSDRQVHCTVGDVIVLMKIDGGEYFELNRVGTRIWQELESPISVATVVERLLPAFDVDQPTCETQVLAWAEKMCGLGFIEINED